MNIRSFTDQRPSQPFWVWVFIVILFTFEGVEFFTWYSIIISTFTVGTHYVKVKSHHLKQYSDLSYPFWVEQFRYTELHSVQYRFIVSASTVDLLFSTMASTNNSYSLRVLAEICSNLPQLTICSPNKIPKKPMKRSAPSSLNERICKKRRTQLKTSLLSLFDQHSENNEPSSSPAATPLTESLSLKWICLNKKCYFRGQNFNV